MTLGLIIPIILAIISFSLMYRYLRLRRTFYSFEDGWLVVKSGVIFRRTKRYDIGHIEFADMEQGPIESITNNRTIELTFDKNLEAKKLHLVGLGPADEVERICVVLNDLAKNLRSHPFRKGLIGT